MRIVRYKIVSGNPCIHVLFVHRVRWGPSGHHCGWGRGFLLCVRRWLIKPIWARNVLWQWGHGIVGTVYGSAARVFLSRRCFWAAAVLVASHCWAHNVCSDEVQECIWRLYMKNIIRPASTSTYYTRRIDVPRTLNRTGNSPFEYSSPSDQLWSSLNYDLVNATPLRKLEALHIFCTVLVLAALVLFDKLKSWVSWTST